MVLQREDVAQLDGASGKIAGKPRNHCQPAFPLRDLQRLDLINESPACLLLPGFDGSNSFVRLSFIEHRGMRAEAARDLCYVAAIADIKVRQDHVGKLGGHFAVLLDWVIRGDFVHL